MAWFSFEYLKACWVYTKKRKRLPLKGTPNAPTSCKQADRAGTYKVTYVKQSGTCGAIDPIVASTSTPPAVGCVIASERWSDNDCTLDRDLTCTSATGAVRTIVVTHASAGAAELTGTIGFVITGPDACSGVYTLDAVRQ